jgi:MFS family permease
MSIIAPFFPSFAKTKGIEEDVVGIIFAAHPLGQFIASLILGKLITHVYIYAIQDNRSILMNTGIVCQGFGLLIFGLLYYSDSRTFVIVGTLFGRALGGMVCK